MKIVVTVFVTFVTLAGCAQQDLKAPCANVATLTLGSVPCDQRQPINVAIIPTTFAQ
ncbi:MAG: hypothetical protein HQ492_02190 [Woeseiaceae bacterium]|nr:hypothetical protein [Woeseiaceae bacterium]